MLPLIDMGIDLGIISYHSSVVPFLHGDATALTKNLLDPEYVAKLEEKRGSVCSQLADHLRPCAALLGEHLKADLTRDDLKALCRAANLRQNGDKATLQAKLALAGVGPDGTSLQPAASSQPESQPMASSSSDPKIPSVKKGTPKHLEGYTMEKLRTICEVFGLPLSGSKAALYGRLESRFTPEIARIFESYGGFDVKPGDATVRPTQTPNLMTHRVLTDSSHRFRVPARVET